MVLGIGIYAFMTVLGLAVIINTLIHRCCMACNGWVPCICCGLGVVNLKAKPAGNITRLTPTTSASAARDGFMMAFLNPKAALFFLALFSQVVGGETSLPAKSGYALTAMLVDMSWYVLVAWLFSQPSWLRWLQHYSHWVGAVFRHYFTVAGGADFQPAAVNRLFFFAGKSLHRQTAHCRRCGAPPNNPCNKSFSSLVTALRFSARGGITHLITAIMFGLIQQLIGFVQQPVCWPGVAGITQRPALGWR